MNLYPALQAEMGSWKYYIVKMRMREVASEVAFATEVYEDKTLDDAIQRDLNEGRVKREIVSFLTRRPDRFFASLVVAAIGGQPKFYPVRITDDPQFQVFADQGLDQSFGVLTFSGDQKYYALDGQHRLKAIKTLMDPNDPLARSCPRGFDNEQISVLIVIKRDEPMNEFLKSYRRLFSSLNRYAKPTDADTNIIMDEDDTFAILTRRLISEYEFFRWVRGSDSPRVQTKGKNLRSTDPHFTSLQTLYQMNETLLSSVSRQNLGWGPGDEGERDVKLFKRFRPLNEDYIDALYDELVVYWNALLKVLPELRSEATNRRVHGADDSGDLMDHFLFWPIGQELMAELARSLLDKRLSEAELQAPTEESAARALAPLASVSWDLHKAPWRNFVLIDTDGTWKMRSEDRKPVLNIGKQIVRWIVRLDDLPTDDVSKLRSEWQNALLPPQEQATIEGMWESVVSQRNAITT